MNRRWGDHHGLRIARPDQVGYTFDMRPDDELIPGRDDLGEVDPGFADVPFADIPIPVDPRDFIRPDGSYDVSELNVDTDATELARAWVKRRNRDATPCPIPYPNREGESL